jgi:hypothetical protein
MWHAWDRIENVKSLVGKHKREIPLKTPRSRWEAGIRMNVREIGWWGVWSEFGLLRIGTDGRLL